MRGRIVTTYDIVIYDKKDIFVLCLYFWHGAPKKTLGIFCDEDNNGVFCFINEVTLGKYPNNLRMGLVGTFSPTPRSPGREEGQGA